MSLLLTPAFFSTISTSRFMIIPGPNAQAQAVACAQVQMTRVQCDAYVVPHHLNGRSHVGVSLAVEKAGGGAGLATYDKHVRGQSENRPNLGDCSVTESGGGNSKYLAHVVCMGDGPREKEGATVQTATFSSLIMSGGRGLDFVVFPPLGVSPYGSLSAEKAAEIMFDAIFDYLKGSKNPQPSQVLIALNGNEAAYGAFAAELANYNDEIGGLSRYSLPPAPLRPSSAPITSKAAITKIVESLTELQLATLLLALGRRDSDMRQRCADLPWFSKLHGLFTEDGGKSMNPFAVAEIRRMADLKSRQVDSIPPWETPFHHFLTKS